MIRRASLALFALILTVQLCGCAGLFYGLFDDKRLTDTMTSDKALATNIKTELLRAHFSEGWNTSVFCYYGKVFLVGLVPPDRQAQAVEIARSFRDVRSVTAQWFAPEKGESSDAALALRLRTELIGAKGVSSTRIDTYVDAGRVVLLGVVHDDAERDLVIRVAKETQGVKEVISFLMLPM